MGSPNDKTGCLTPGLFCRGDGTTGQAGEDVPGDIREIDTSLRTQHPDLNTDCGKRKRDNDTTEYDESNHEIHSFFVQRGFSTEAINAAITEKKFSVSGPCVHLLLSPA